MKAETWFALFVLWFLLGLFAGDLGAWLLGKRNDRPTRYRDDIRRPW